VVQGCGWDTFLLLYTRSVLSPLVLLIFQYKMSRMKATHRKNWV
jgi:hypothetical protein